MVNADKSSNLPQDFLNVVDDMWIALTRCNDSSRTRSRRSSTSRSRWSASWKVHEGSRAAARASGRPETPEPVI